MTDCLFCKIATGDIPAKLAYQDDRIVVFHDIHPKAPVHLLIIPRHHIDSMLAVTMDDAELLGYMMAKIPELAKMHGLAAGFKTAINTGRAGGQEVFHLHIHVYGQPA